MKFRVLFILLLWSTVCFGQYSELSIDKRLSQYVIRHWSAESGINSEAVIAIQQTKDQYIWLATHQGLVRFDGVSFSNYTKQNTPNLPSSHIVSLSPSLDGGLWIGTSNGLVQFSKNEFLLDLALKPLQGASIEQLFVDSKNALWIATAAGQIYSFQAGQLEEHSKKIQLGKSVIQAICEDEAGYVWFGTNDSRLIRCKNTLVKEYPCPSKLNGILDIHAFKAVILLGCGGGLFTFDPQRISVESTPINATVQQFIIDQHSYVWAATLKGIMRMKVGAGDVDLIDESSGLPNEIIQSLLFDVEGNLWAGTYRDGLLQFTDGSYTTFSATDGLSSNIVCGISQLDSTRFLMGTEDNQLFVLKKGRVSPYDLKLNIPKSRLKHLFTDKQNRIWISTYSGLVMQTGVETKLYNRASGFPDNLIRVVFQDSKGTIWVGTKTAGLIYFTNPENWQQLNIEKGLCSDYIMSISETADSTLVISTVNGISFVKNNKVVKTLNTSNGLPSNFTFASYPDGKYIWIASNEGIWRYDGQAIKVISTKNGLPHNSAFNFLDDQLGNLWIPSEKTIIKIPKIQLHAVANGEMNLIDYESFGKSDGLKSSSCLGATQSFTDYFGRFWIPTQGGLALLNPKKVPHNKSKITVHLEKISSDKRVYTTYDSIQVNPGNNRLNFSFTAFYYKQPDQIRFTYKLEPYDNAWVTGNSSRTADYTNMEPGVYTFLLKATLKNTQKSDLVQYRIEILPEWWQTKLFRILGVLLAVLLVYIVLWLRTRALGRQRKRLRELVKERTDQLEKQRAQLEVLVDKRTEEIGRQNEELEVQAEFLKLVNEELSIKNIDLEAYNQKVEQQKYLIERSNEHLRSSIRYALTIQKAMLAGRKSFQDVLDSFIIYRPKDIVSGDFYWASPSIEHRKGIISRYVAVIDCTGHGVPGAFMSMIGHQLLDSIIFDKRIESPKDILTELHSEIRKTLRQDETSNTDGMDVCLCLFEHNVVNDQVNVRFSGAKRPLYRFDYVNNTLEKIEPTRRSIGGAFIRNQYAEFQEKTFEFYPSDTLYLTTDGYIHQPNKNREAFGSLRFEQLLAENGKKPLDEQEFILAEQLDFHQGESIQRDDITIMALRRRAAV